MNYCRSLKIECPFALSDIAPVPCVGSQEQCNEVVKLHKEEKNERRDRSHIG